MVLSLFKIQIRKFWLLFFLIIYVAPGTASDPAALFPEFPGWKKAGNPQVYQPDNLYEYINGAADLYLTYDFQELLVGEYLNDQQAEVIIEIYRHGAPEQVFGIYSQERPEEGTYLPVGAEGYVEGPMLNFINDVYYVKISGSELTGSPEEVIKSIGHRISEAIGRTPLLPRELSCFPKKDLKSRSEKYIHRNFLGYEFLHSGFTADYQYGDQGYRLFIIKGENKNDCIQMLKTWQKKSSPMKNPSATDGLQIMEERHTFDDPYSGKISLEWRENYIWGCIGFSSGYSIKEQLDLLRTCMEDSLLNENSNEKP